MNLLRPLRLMSLYAKVSVQNFAAYRFDLYIRLILSLMHLSSELLFGWVVYSNTKSVNGWRWQHFVVLIGIYRMVAGGIRMSIVPNMRRVLEDIREGTLDFVLLRPVNSQFLVSIREFVIWRLIDVMLGLTVAIYGCVKLSGVVPYPAAARFALVLGAGFVIIYGFWLMLATLCFWFIRLQNIEMVFWNVFEAGRFPIGIYGPKIRFMLTYVIPLAFITTVPAEALMGKANPLVPTAPFWAVLIAIGMLLLSSWFWRFGLRRYSGASS